MSKIKIDLNLLKLSPYIPPNLTEKEKIESFLNRLKRRGAGRLFERIERLRKNNWKEEWETNDQPTR